MKFSKLLLLSTVLFFSNSVLGKQVKRHILALYDSERGQTEINNHIHKYAEVILNHSGCMVEYWDIAQELPDDKYMKKYSGIITWFYDNAMNQPEKYLNWASRQIAANKKFVVLGNLLDFKNKKNGKPVSLTAINKFCQRLGLVAGGISWTDDITKIELVSKVPGMVEFERSLDYELTFYAKYTSVHPQNKIYLKIKRNDLPNSESDLVITTPYGGFAFGTYIMYEDEDNFDTKWRINPFTFFEEAFGLREIPRPDVTTLNGSRIWCSHIDGDAFISQSQVNPNLVCAEIIRDEILQRYKWPISVSIVVAEVNQSSKYQDIARSIYRIKWVEAASHSFSHPFYWADNYAEADKYEHRNIQIAGYTFNVRDEIVGSVNYINKKLLPPDKKVKTFFWTGNCQPTAEALKYCQEINLNNFNGGDTVFDKYYQSYTTVTPIGVQVGKFRQIYSPNANENIYTNEWEGPFYGYKLVLNTFENTESPIRIKPINIYYHFYSGEKWAALNALKEVIEKTIVQDVAPMFISEYIDIVQGYYSTQIEKAARDRWKIKNFGKCTTIRFDDNQMFPDFYKSKGVLGFLHYQGSLYIHLKNTNKAEIVLTDVEPEETYLKQGSHRVIQWRAQKKKVSFKTNGYGTGYFVIANLIKNKKYYLSITEIESNRINNSNFIDLRTDAKGELFFHHPMNGPIEVNISLEL